MLIKVRIDRSQPHYLISTEVDRNWRTMYELINDDIKLMLTLSQKKTNILYYLLLCCIIKK